MQSDETDEIAAYLMEVAAQGDSAQRVAEDVELSLKHIEKALTPIVGLRGVAALYKRALHLSKTTYPWMPDPPAGAPTAMDSGPLTTALAQHTAPDAAAAGARLLRDFRDLLITLIGPLLTERLLRSVWAKFLSGPSAQGNTK